MARSILAILAAVATLTQLASAGCAVDILNINQASVASGCVPEGGEAMVAATVPPGKSVNYLVLASDSCGVSVSSNQVLPDGWSVAAKGKC